MYGSQSGELTFRSDHVAKVKAVTGGLQYILCSVVFQLSVPGGGRGVQPGSSNPGQFQTKIFHFPHPFSDLASKIHTCFQTFVVS